MTLGVISRAIYETPFAIVDFETTGLTPGADRVVEVSVVRVDPGAEPRLVLDTLINPCRPVTGTEIHGITDADVQDAPVFGEVAGELVRALEGCVVAAYNVYFDIKFLTFEMANLGVRHEPPHVCLMYMRPMLGLGPRCRLDEACREHGIRHEATHMAACDAQACGWLLMRYLEELHRRHVRTLGELTRLGSYKFLRSLANAPYPSPSDFRLSSCSRLRSRAGRATGAAAEGAHRAMGEYWEALRTVLADLEVTDDEVQFVLSERKRLGLSPEQVRVLHARAFAHIVQQFSEDERLDDGEVEKLRRLHRCLSALGWAPGD